MSDGKGTQATSLPFARPKLSSVAAFVGREHQKREREEQDKRKKLKAERVQREAAREEDENERCAHAREREETMRNVELLCPELSELVQRLSEIDGAAVEMIAGAIFDGPSPLCLRLRLFWAENHASVACWTHPRVEPVWVTDEAGQRTKESELDEQIEGHVGKDRAERRVPGVPTSTHTTRKGVVRLTPESTKSRAQKTELFLKLNIRKTLCAPLQHRNRGGGGRVYQMKSPERIGCGRRKGDALVLGDGGQLGTALKACKVCTTRAKLRVDPSMNGGT